MPALRRFLALKAEDRALVVEAALLLNLLRVTFRAVPFARLHAWLERWSRRWIAKPRGRENLVFDERRVAAAVNAVARRLPGRPTCLVEALVVEAMLRRRGGAPRLRFGVRRPDSVHKSLEAHAWVESGGRIVVGDLDGFEQYATLSDAQDS